jgi:exosortase C (VPDSG-CTERM-specific)
MLFKNFDHWRSKAAFACAILLLIGYLPIFYNWFQSAISSDLHSHVILIPVVSIYLLQTTVNQNTWDSRPSFVAGGFTIAITALSGGWVIFDSLTWSGIDKLAFQLLTFLGFLWGICLFFLGARWVYSASFPLGFLLLMIPVPDAIIGYLEQLLMLSSAWTAELIFDFAGVPVHKNGQILELPQISLEVAQECSGIRSSWVLLITSILAAYLFLPDIPKRAMLVFFVLPLAILRNALRIFVIGWLCVNEGPEMVDSWIHKKGGPLFFVASLVPLLILASILRASPVVKTPRKLSNFGTSS